MLTKLLMTWTLSRRHYIGRHRYPRHRGAGLLVSSDELLADALPSAEPQT
jgi:hypothetical protein